MTYIRPGVIHCKVSILLCFQFSPIFRLPSAITAANVLASQMAGLQEQIRQLEGVNDDMIGESERYERFLITVLDA